MEYTIDMTCNANVCVHHFFNAESELFIKNNTIMTLYLLTRKFQMLQSVKIIKNCMTVNKNFMMSRHKNKTILSNISERTKYLFSSLSKYKAHLCVSCIQTFKEISWKSV